MKAGLKFAQRVTTVSPTYAREIGTHEFGFGLDGVIRGRGTDVSGVLNGVDGTVWDPSTDAGLVVEQADGIPRLQPHHREQVMRLPAIEPARNGSWVVPSSASATSSRDVSSRWDRATTRRCSASSAG